MAQRDRQQRRHGQGGPIFGRVLRGEAAITLAVVMLLVGALTLWAVGWPLVGASLANTPGGPGTPGPRVGLGLEGNALATATDVPTAVPTATNTLPTATPVPVGPITFPCASGTMSSTPGYMVADVCVQTTPGSVVSVVATMCAGDAHENIWSDIHVGASGAAEDRAWSMQTSCAPPFTVTLSATGTAADGSAEAGSGRFVASQ